MHKSHSSSQRGFTLVELLVAVALGLLVMIALVAVYLNVSRTNTEMAKTNSMIESGRFAVDVLNEDIAHAGYLGGYVPMFDDVSSRVLPTGVPGTTALALGPCLAYASWDNDYRDMLLGIPVEAYENATPTGCSAVVTDRRPGTDVLVVRHVETCLPGSTNCDAFDPEQVHFQPSFCAVETAAGNRYTFTASTTALGTTTYVRKARGCTVDATAPGGTTGTYAPIRKWVSHMYYVRNWANASGDGIPTLVRSAFGKVGGVPRFQPAQALIEGIEAFTVELGIDSASRCAGSATDYTKAVSLGPIAGGGSLVVPATCTYNAAAPTSNTLPLIRGDGVPEAFVRCPSGGCTANQLRDAVAVKLFVLARSRDKSPGHVDTKTYTLGTGSPTLVITPTGEDAKFKRHVFQTTIRLNNVSGRRETPSP